MRPLPAPPPRPHSPAPPPRRLAQALISSIFIYEACKALLYPFKKDYDTCVEGQPCLDTLKDAIHDASTLMSLLLLRPGTATARSRLARGLTGA